MDKSPWRPSWWNEETHGQAWDKVREVMIRDRGEMRRELRRPEGELDRELQEAAKRAYGAEHSEGSSAPTLREVYGDPDAIEVPLGYGYCARQQYLHDHPTWSNDLENQLRLEWERAGTEAGQPWDRVREFVRHGYEYSK